MKYVGGFSIRKLGNTLYDTHVYNALWPYLDMMHYSASIELYICCYKLLL